MRAIETLYAERIEAQVERIAYHAPRGEAWTKAGAYLRWAGQRAGERLANRDAVAYLDHALGALEHLDRALAIYRGMGMQHWPQQAEAALDRLREH